MGVCQDSERVYSTVDFFLKVVFIFMYYLYYLLDPNTDIVRYIGITNNPDRRLKEHIRDCKKSNSHKDNWLKSLLENNQIPIQKIIAETKTKKEVIELEISHIQQFTGLTNSTTGGEYFTFDEKVLLKLREKNKGKNNPCYGRKWSDEEKEKLSKKRKGRKLNETWKDNLRKSAKRIEIIIDGKQYDSINQAAKELNLSWETVRNRFLKNSTEK